MNTKLRKRRIVSTFVISAFLVLAAGTLWVLYSVSPSWLPAFAWLKPAGIVLGALGVAIPVLGALFSDIVLPLLDRLERSASLNNFELNRLAPLQRVSCETLIARLGDSGRIPWIDRGLSSLSLLYAHDRIAIVGPMKSGKTREAIELIRMAQQNGLAAAIYQPTGAISVIDPEALASAVVAQLDQQCILFIDDIGAVQDETYLRRLSICIDSIARNRPDARFVITLQVERLRLSPALQTWVDRHRFHHVEPPDLTPRQRRELAESGMTTLGASLTADAVAELGRDAEITKPWEIVWVLQAAAGFRSDKLPLNADDVRALLADGEQAVWAEQRRSMTKVEPATDQLLESIGVFFSAGLTPRQSSITRYAAFLMPRSMRPEEKRLHLTQAAQCLQLYSVVPADGLFGIPEPRLLPLIVGADQARVRLNDFLAAYSPGLWRILAMRLLEPLDFVFRPRQQIGVQAQVWSLWFRICSALNAFNRRLALPRPTWLPSFGGLNQTAIRFLESIYAWPADRALLAAELGSPTSSPAFLSSNVMAERGRLALIAGSFRAAFEHFSMAIALNPTNATAFMHRGEAHRRLHRLDKALTDLDCAIELDPDSTRALLERAKVWEGMEQWDKALADCTRAIELNAEYVQAIHDRGVIYFWMGQIENSLADFGRAIDMHANDAFAIAAQGIIYRRMGRLEKALANFDRAIKLDKHEHWYRYQRALTLTVLGKSSEAKTDLDAAIKLAEVAYERNHGNAEDAFHLLLYCFVSGQQSRAEKLLPRDMAERAPMWNERAATSILDDLLLLFPGHPGALSMRELLTRSQEHERI